MRAFVQALRQAGAGALYAARLRRRQQFPVITLAPLEWDGAIATPLALADGLRVGARNDGGGEGRSSVTDVSLDKRLNYGSLDCVMGAASATWRYCGLRAAIQFSGYAAQRPLRKSLHRSSRRMRGPSHKRCAYWLSVSYKSSHSGFSRSISVIFHARFQFLSRFSSAIASSMRSNPCL